MGRIGVKPENWKKLHIWQPHLIFPQTQELQWKERDQFFLESKNLPTSLPSLTPYENKNNEPSVTTTLDVNALVEDGLSND
ncbi:hypothetical protein PROFUN_10745 [Planoprotostelium fungivorum]|uniref:Uncharacterized protein n=1 Tax=Planoprotostelium fungivorum TaxID=1890364 RepID=A0A2P6N7Y4_9EUKA|nr:hypothetical protein PROFUN_10745 [Planoprotostelium fungivorum]